MGGQWAELRAAIARETVLRTEIADLKAIIAQLEQALRDVQGK